jgi:succinate dehydrogenase/fumarate reductase-like Fe-S protein
MADRITVQVERYRPEEESEPTWQSYEVPLREDWSVLDGLNSRTTSTAPCPTAGRAGWASAAAAG